MDKSGATPPKEAGNKSSKPRKTAFWWFREAIALLLWGALISALWGCPWWSHIASSLSLVTGHALLVTTLVVFSATWLFSGNRAIWVSLFVVAYPLVWGLRILPRLFAKHWPLLVIFLPGVRSILKTFRRRVALAALALAAGVVALTSSNTTALHISWWSLVAYLAWHYLQRIIHTYQSTTVYSQLADLLEKGASASWLPSPKEMKEKIRKQKKAKPDDKNPAAPQYLICYAFSTALWYIADKLDRLHKSSKIDLYLMISALCTLTLNICLFSVVYLSLHRSNPINFSVSEGTSPVNFLAFSFCNHFFSSLSHITPEAGVSRMFCVIQQCSCVLWGSLVGLVLFTSCKERHSRDLGLVVKKFQNASDSVGAVFERDFRITLQAVEGMLISFSPDIARWLIKVRYGQARAEVLFSQYQASNVIEAQTVVVPASDEQSALPASSTNAPQKKPKRRNRRR
jgi:hypothetical protein